MSAKPAHPAPSPSRPVLLTLQTNHLGAYKLTRLLEKKLVASKARIVTVSSVTHRIVTIRDVTAFLKGGGLRSVLIGFQRAAHAGVAGG